MKDELYHWTEELFDKHPELFLGAFEERLDNTSHEINTLLSYLSQQGYHPQRLLDLNCGIGRHSIELGQRGVRVLGTDISSYYIDIAREKARQAGVADNVTFQIADMREISSALSGKGNFDGIVCLWTSFGFYDDKTNENILHDCLSLVKPGGFFLLEVVNRDWLLQNYAECRFTRFKDRILLQEGEFNPYNSRNYSTWTFLKQSGADTYTVEKAIELDHRIWSLHELVNLFENAGWRYEAVYPGLATPGFNTAPSAYSLADDDILGSNMLSVLAYRP